MELLLNGINNKYLMDILARGTSATERVQAAVAYATDNRLMFDWCWDNHIPLHFWGRFDETVPISISVLERFLNRGSGRYVCKLVRHFHPKVIWWHGYGVYIGSANLTQSAWSNNVEAGVFLTDGEVLAQGLDLQLIDFFEKIDEHASPLTNELFALMQQRQKELSKRWASTREGDDRFLETGLVKPWAGLVRASSQSASDEQRASFLDEWNSTLQIIRDIGAKVSKNASRPGWIDSAVPWGAQADQFLHAHYYERTFDGRRADFDTYFARNKSDPDRAVEETIDWWRSLPAAPNGEDVALNVVAPKLLDAFSERKILGLSEDEFAEALAGVHAATEYARRVKNQLVDLKEGVPYTIPEKIDALARHIYRSPKRGRPSPLETLHFVLYGGKIDDVPTRLWEALTDQKRRVDLLGVSALGEIVGWAMPNAFPPRNGRTSKALRSLGYDVRVHV